LLFNPLDIGEDENFVRCRFLDCFVCCKETEMLLTQNDVKNIEQHGFKSDEFLLSKDDSDGFLQLKNKDSKLGTVCFFLNDNGKCGIYEYRPEGCRLYPLIINLDTNEEMIDEDCREKIWFTKQKYSKNQVTQINNLVIQLFLENDNY